MGPLLAATKAGSVLVLGPSAPPDLIPDSPGLPFLVELSPAGAVLRSFALPDAPGPEVLTVGSDGTIFFAGQAGPGAVGTETLPEVESGYYLAKLSPTFEVLAVTAIESPSTQVNALHVDDDGDLIVGTAIADFEAGSMQPAVTKFAGDTLEPDWSVTFEHEIMPALIYGLRTLPDGRIVAGGLYSRRLTIGSFVLDKELEGQDDDFAYAGWVAWLSPIDGEPLMAETFGGAVSDGVSDLEVTTAGTVRLLINHSGGPLALFGTTIDLQGHPYALVDLDDSGVAQNIVPFGGPEATALDLAIGADGSTYVTGGYGDPVGALEQRGAEILRIDSSAPAGGESLSTGHSVSEVVVDAAGGVWISGGWETAFDWNGQTHAPTSPIAEEACRLVLRSSSF